MKRIKAWYDHEPISSILAFMVMLAVVMWIMVLVSVMANRNDDLWKDALEGVLITFGIVSAALFCAGCAWLADHKNTVLKVIGSILCFLLFSVFFVGCTGLIITATS